MTYQESDSALIMALVSLISKGAIVLSLHDLNYRTRGPVNIMVDRGHSNSLPTSHFSRKDESRWIYETASILIYILGFTLL